MAKQAPLDLSRRERQIMEILYRKKQADARQVQAEMPDTPSYSALRTMLRILEEKGHLTHKQKGRKYIYCPVVAPEKARRSAMRNMLDTFFDGSVAGAVASLLDTHHDKLSGEELDRLSQMIEKARKDGK